MSTQVRDAIVQYLLSVGATTFGTVDHIADALKLNRDSVASALNGLWHKQIAQRRQIEGSNAYEYAAGKRINYGAKHAGRKFPFHRKAADAPASPGVPVMASGTVGNIGLFVNLDGRPRPMSLKDARSLYEQLKAFFGE